MKAWQLAKGATSLNDMTLIDAPQPEAGPGEVLIRVRACSINYRDHLIPLGQYMGGSVDRDITPLSDGAGEVVAVGAGVTRFAVGDRVAGTFFQMARPMTRIMASATHIVASIPRAAGAACASAPPCASVPA